MPDTLRRPSAHKYPKASPWVGWIAFAAVCMVILGSFHLMQGLIAIVDADYFPIAGEGPVTDMSLDGVGLGAPDRRGSPPVRRSVRLRRPGLGAHARVSWWPSRSLVANFGFLGAYPLWSLMMIALDIVVILALTVHGSDIKP